MNFEGGLEGLVDRDWETNPDPGTVRFAVVGLGGFARTRALPALDRTDFCEAAVLVSGSPETARRLQAEHEVPRVLTYEEFERGEATDAYDAVFLSLPNAHHLEFTETAAGLGKHVLCEKPMETTVDRADRMVRACDEAGVELMVAYRLQTEPPVRRLRDAVQDGLVGDVVQLHGALSFPVLDTGGADQWRLDESLAGGGALVDIGVYHVNTSRFLLDQDPVAVQGSTAATSAAFDEVEEHVSFELTFPGAISGAFTASYNAHPDSFIYLLGTEGTVRVENVASLQSRRIVVETDDASIEIPEVSVNEVVEEFDYFAHAVLTGTTPEPDGADGRTDVRVMDAVYEAARTGSRVALE